MDVESSLVTYLSAELDTPVAADVPAPRPDEFITLERTGGGLDNVIRDCPTVAIQCWAKTRTRAEEIAEDVRDVMPAFAYFDGICRVALNTFNFYPTSHAEPRYQLVYNIVMRRD